MSDEEELEMPEASAANNDMFDLDLSAESMTSENEHEEMDSVDASDSQIFDTNIPTTHPYLGRLENVRGYTLYEGGEVLTLPAIYTNTLVFPGFTLPLLISNTDYDIGTGFNFVLVWLIEENRTFFDYGVVMEVFEHDVQDGVANIKARGRQRCSILRQHIPLNSRHQMCKAKVRILPEPEISSTLSGTQLKMLQAHYSYKWKPHAAATSRRRFHAAQTAIPLWVHDRYEVDYYVDKILRRLARNPALDAVPRDPVALSYWFAQNYQLMDRERLHILQTNTTLNRLRLALKYLLIERDICCGNCIAVISHPNEVFPMSKDGVQSNYVNPGGVVFETITVRKIEHYVTDGEPSDNFSWFPGYSWTIVKCSRCGNHLGWQFTAKKLKPSLFYGLARTCLCIMASAIKYRRD